MDVLREFLENLKRRALWQGHFLGLLNVLIGRRLDKPDGNPIANGLTWRDVAALLKRVRWDKAAVTEVGLDPSTLPPRDRQKYWYTAIAQAHVDSPQASQAGDAFADILRQEGYQVGPAPGTAQP
jgi:hypothetical protein